MKNVLVRSDSTLFVACAIKLRCYRDDMVDIMVVIVVVLMVIVCEMLYVTCGVVSLLVYL
jgi:hypothetical protein